MITIVADALLDFRMTGNPRARYSGGVELFLGDDGIFGVPVAASASYIVLVIIFGQLLQKSRALEFFMNLALVLTGRALEATLAESTPVITPLRCKPWQPCARRWTPSLTA